MTKIELTYKGIDGLLYPNIISTQAQPIADSINRFNPVRRLQFSAEIAHMVEKRSIIA